MNEYKLILVCQLLPGWIFDFFLRRQSGVLIGQSIQEDHPAEAFRSTDRNKE